SEDEFLNFLPMAQRKALRASWYRGGMVVDVTMALLDPLHEKNIESQVRYEDPARAKEELLAQVLGHRMNPGVRGPLDAINVHGAAPGDAAAAQLAKVAKRAGDFAQVLPEVSLIRLREQ